MNRSCEINPNSLINSVAWLDKGFALQRLDNHNEAIKCFDKVIELKPDDPDAWLSKGFSLSRLGNKSDAIKCFDKVIQLDPNNKDASRARGTLLKIGPT